ncbi:MAG: hypothetical protein IJU68_01910 [Bacteroidales bacterium]|nr:hypothetical protein [Bacteroidales bacterium]
MKKPADIALLLGLLLCLSVHLSAQTDVSIQQLAGSVKEPYSELDSSRVATGYLMDRALDLVDVCRFDGTALFNYNRLRLDAITAVPSSCHTYISFVQPPAEPAGASFAANSTFTAPIGTTTHVCMKLYTDPQEIRNGSPVESFILPIVSRTMPGPLDPIQL